ncbi:MAG: response regulator [Anaerolineae bacterium]
MPEEKALQSVAESRYDLVIVDASAVGDVLSLVSRLRAQQPQTRIVVVTASPTWQRAREALRAGAADYIRKSLDGEELRSKIQAVLDAPPPAGPN